MTLLKGGFQNVESRHNSFMIWAHENKLKKQQIRTGDLSRENTSTLYSEYLDAEPALISPALIQI